MRCLNLTVVGLLTLSAAAVWAAPEKINYQGYLTDDQGVALNGDFDIEFRIYTAPTGGDLLWGENHTPLPVTDGIFHVVLGEFDPIPSAVFDGDRWLQVEIRPDPPFPRQQLLSVPYALRATVADVALTGAPDDDWTIAGANVYRLNGNVGIGTSTPAKKLHVETTDLGIDAGDLVNENIVVEASDAIVGLYSNTGGSYGSGLSLGEVSGGNVSNRWDLTRRTTAGGGALETRYFDGTTTTELMRVQPDGKVGIGTSEPESQLSVDGDVDAWHLEVRQSRNGGFTERVGIYTNNVIRAYGHVREDGVLLHSYGVESMEKLGVGRYRIQLEDRLWSFVVAFGGTLGVHGEIPLPVVEDQNNDGRFDVRVLRWTGTTFVQDDLPFQFMVTGIE